MIDWLDETQPPCFPQTDRALADPCGLLAAGGQASPLWLDAAYRQGIFPWNDPDEVRLWWSPAPRAVITPDSFRIPRTVRKLIKRLSPGCSITTNLAFEQVIHACSEPREYSEGTWIDDELMAACLRMHRAGRAISAELWSEEGQLIGGFYALIKGKVIFGESMFSRRSNASKITFAIVAQAMFDAGIQLIDCQMYTDHLAQFGAVEIERAAFESLLKQHISHSSNIRLPDQLKVGLT